VFRFTLFWERSILIIKEARARRIKIVEEVEARGRQAGGAASGAEAARREPMLARALGGLEQELLFAMIWGQTQTHVRRTVSAFDG
jgi:hypothetical protein